MGDPEEIRMSWGGWRALDASRGGEIAQSVASLSATQSAQVRARLDPLVSERWNSITVLLTLPTSSDDWFKKGGPCVIMFV